MHKYIHTYSIHTCMHTNMHTYIQTYTHMYPYKPMHATQMVGNTWRRRARKHGG